MVHLAVSTTPDACVWMTGGVLNYKLCDRNFDCEHCPLDAVMRGDRHVMESLTAGGESAYHGTLFPEDRRYSGGHTWIAPTGSDDGRVRVGLDAFAAALVSRPVGVRWRSSDGRIDSGATVCELRLGVGVLRLGAPVVARSTRPNRDLRADARAIVSDPYGSGWLLELVPTDRKAVASLLSPEAAQTQADLDLRRFRRRVAHRLLADGSPLREPSLHCAESLADLRRLLGPPRYLKLLRELVH